jgi:hypothetical protein
VLVSADADENGFNRQFARMPWLALPFAARDRAAALRARFGADDDPSQPQLVAVGRDGSTRGLATVLGVRGGGRCVCLEKEGVAICRHLL